ncbi:NmrA family NAD(P)-binding protein [Kitasatospora viridis]|uniref:NAD(P)H dehydrogenase (Quinone) n=1 Tax=Kitasatospora viridis TaxID=281105 RepID=A0A561TTU5_9ACTN|nr:NmrA family NAD(P)-binding protein [Kitasatospora viridis]TWF90528.1 NAD(P)H dehydrogenase (quinone) [Kitasatospora viridis]
MILVTGASGSLGGLILSGLRALPDLEVVAGTRTGDGRTARRVDFDDPASLPAAFTGVDVLLAISAGYAEDDVVLARHGALVDAAAAAGVRQVIYTSLAASGDSMTIALAHRWTEERLAAAPFAHTVLRNGLYTNVPLGLVGPQLAQAAATGVLRAPLGGGRISVVVKQDLADAAVRVAAEAQRDLAADRRHRHAGRVYELEGETAIGGAEIAEALTAAYGRPISYEPSSLAASREALTAAGFPPFSVTHALSIAANANAGRALARSSDLRALLPAAPRSVPGALAAQVAPTQA